MWLEADQLPGQVRETLGAPFGKSVFQDDVLAFNITELAQAFSE
jgi:hypothetical protein